MNVELNAFNIGDSYSLGKTENGFLKIELLTYSKKIEIFSNCGRLKGSYISISLGEVKLQKTHMTFRWK